MPERRSDPLPFESDPKQDFQKTFNRDLFTAGHAKDPVAATKALDNIAKNTQRLGGEAQSMDPLGNQLGSEDQLRLLNKDKRADDVEKMLGSEKLGPAGKEALAEFKKMRDDITKSDWAALTKDSAALEKTMSGIEKETTRPAKGARRSHERAERLPLAPTWLFCACKRRHTY
jgi:hypothetical protein